MNSVYCWPLGILRTNTFLLVNEETKDAVFVDCGVNPQEALAKVQDEGLRVWAVLLTHAHFDHIAGLEMLMETLGHEIPIYLHQDEHSFLSDSKQNMSFPYYRRIIELSLPKLYSLEEGQRLLFGQITLSVWHTPGHSPGGVSFFWEEANSLFSGDCLMKGTIGRVDLVHSCRTSMKKSLDKIFSYPDNLRLYAGHGEPSDLFSERHQYVSLGSQFKKEIKGEKL